jgi:hypothetical protein
MQSRALLQELDCSLLQQLGVPSSSSSSSSNSTTTTRSGWQSTVHAVPGGEQVLIDVLAPSAIHADAAVKVAVSGGVLTLTLSEGPAKQSAKQSSAKQKQGAEAAAPAGLKTGCVSVQLPQGVVDGQPAATKMSQALGLVVVRAALSK